MLNTIDRECIEAVSNKFYNVVGYSLGHGNGYEQTILRPRLDELEEKVKDTYPEYYRAFANVKAAYLENFQALYADKKNTVDKNSNASQMNA